MSQNRYGCVLLVERDGKGKNGGNVQLNPEESEEKTVMDEIIKQEERKILFYAIQELPIMMKEVNMYFQVKGKRVH